MKPALLPALAALALLLGLAACAPQIAVPTAPGYPPAAPCSATTYPYPPDLTALPSPASVLLSIPTPDLSAVPPDSWATATPVPPVAGTEAQVREAALRLEPYFQLAPFFGKADGVYREYAGCPVNTSVGAIVGYQADYNAEIVEAAFEPFLEALGVETHGWKEIDIGANGPAFELLVETDGTVALQVIILQHPPDPNSGIVASEMTIELALLEHPVDGWKDKSWMGRVALDCPGEHPWWTMRPQFNPLWFTPAPPNTSPVAP